MEHAAAQKCVGQFFFCVRGDYNDGPLLGLDGLFSLRNVEFHFVPLPEQIVGEFQIGLVDLVNEQDHLLVGRKRFAQFA